MEVCTGPGGERGLFAKATIERGEVIIAVPRACHIVAPEDGSFAALGSEHQRQSTRLAAKLLRDGAHTDNPQGPFAEYYKSLPRFVDVPLMWEAQDLLELGQCRTLSVLRTHKRRLLDQFKLVQQSPGLQNVSWEAFLWAITVVLSRNFNWRERDAACTSDGPATQLCLAPFLDMANHHPAATEQTHYGARQGRLVLTCKKEIGAGEQILISYGNLGNEELLVQYGFALQPNVDADGDMLDEVGFQLLMQPQLFGWKASLFKAAGYNMDGSHPIRVATTCAGRVSELLSVFRLYVADSKDVAFLQSRSPAPKDAHDIATFSLKNELQTMALLWQYAAVNAAGMSVSSRPEDVGRALPLVVDAIFHQRPLHHTDDRGAPAIIGLIEAAFQECGAVAAQEPLEFNRSRAAAEECGSHQRPPGENHLETAAMHRELVCCVVNSERRVFAHFALLAAVCAGLLQPGRAGLLPSLSGAPALAGWPARCTDSLLRSAAKVILALGEELVAVQG